MTQKPEIRVGQIWGQREQSNRSKVVSIHSDHFRSMDLIGHPSDPEFQHSPGATWGYPVDGWDGVAFRYDAQTTSQYDLTTLLYDPPDP